MLFTKFTAFIIAHPFQKEKLPFPKRKRVSNEDFYIYHIIHMAKHFINGGIGIVHILDIWIMINAYRSVDKDYIAGELKSIGLLDFEKNARALCKY